MTRISLLIAIIVLTVISCYDLSKNNSKVSIQKTNVMKMQSKISGKGTPVVLVPGGLTGWISWDPHAKILSKKHKVIQVQLLNVQYGIEDKLLPEDYSIKTESNALAETLIDLKDTMPVDMVGWSYGAFTALQYALDHPTRVRSLTLIEPPAMWVLRTNGKFDEQTQKEADFFTTLHGEITEDMLADFLQHAGFLKAGQSARELPQWNKWLDFRRSLRNSPSLVAYTDDIKRLQQFSIPTLLVKGTGSSPWLHKIIDVLSNSISNSRVIELPGGHAPHIVSMDKFMEELERFQNAPAKLAKEYTK